ncbi:MAG: hypothetical protein ACR2MD_11450, partial [Aridibacter sp.]
NGTIKLPKKSLKRYGFEQKMPVCLIETREGILLVPITDKPMSEELKQELAEWQEAAGETFEDFPYEESKIGKISNEKLQEIWQSFDEITGRI